MLIRKLIRKWFFCLVFSLSSLSFSILADELLLKRDHPQQYRVKAGDTLWDISGKFLQYPWQWSEIWRLNPQVQNPHLIYPGDLLYLEYIDGKPILRLALSGQPYGNKHSSKGTVFLSPRVREQSLDRAITTIPYESIRPYLTFVSILEDAEMASAGYILRGIDDSLIYSNGSRIYVRGLDTTKPLSKRYIVFRRGKVFIDPESQEVLGIEAEHVAEAVPERGGDPITMQIQASNLEALAGDRVYPNPKQSRPRYMPRKPDRAINGYILSVSGGKSVIGQFDVVVINRGTREGLEAGHVLQIYKAGSYVRDPFAKFTEVQLPDQYVGLLMVFREFEKVSLALVLETRVPLEVLDKVRTPYNLSARNHYK